MSGPILDCFGRERHIQGIGHREAVPNAHFRGDEMTEQAVIDSDPLVFTSAAAKKVAELIADEGNPELMLRIYVQGGGCSGFQYGFTFDESVNEGDEKVVTDGVTLLIDPMSIQYLMGAEVDYSEGLQGAQFVIRNPNATTTCGCGSSFSA
jgi:iron-sulfur cluster insertion protein